MARFFTERCTSLPPQHLEYEMSFLRTGGLDLCVREAETETVFTGLLRDRARGLFQRVVVEVEWDEPWRVTRFSAEDVPPPPGMAVPRTSERDALAALGERLAGAVAEDAFSGTVLVARKGVTIFSGAYGYRDRERGVTNSLDTRFCIGSMGKMFTGVAVIQLVQAGKIELSAPFGEYVPGYPDRDAANRVTVHHLLTHTGGTGDIFGPDFPAVRGTMDAVEDYVAAYGTRGLAFEPGSRWEYSNYGFVLLGLVIERVAGRSYNDYIAGHVLGSAGMHSTCFQPEQEVPEHAIGYSRSSVAAPWRASTGLPAYRGSPAGGAYSTAGDMAGFAEALLECRLLDAAHTALVTTGKVAARGGRYGYGFADYTVDGVRYFGHGGGAPGISGDLRIYPDSRYTAVALANLDPPAAVSMSAFIGDRLPSRSAAGAT